MEQKGSILVADAKPRKVSELELTLKADMAKLQDVYAQKRNHFKNELRFDKQSKMMVRYYKRPGTAIKTTTNATNLTETVDDCHITMIRSPKQQTTA